jgi:hypothetical protein
MSSIVLIKNGDTRDFVDKCGGKDIFIPAGGQIHQPIEVAKFLIGDLSLPPEDLKKNLSGVKLRRGEGYSELVTYEEVNDGVISAPEVVAPKIPLKKLK